MTADTRVILLGPAAAAAIRRSAESIRTAVTAAIGGDDAAGFQALCDANALIQSVILPMLDTAIMPDGTLAPQGAGCGG
jgi:hypothetical protein